MDLVPARKVEGGSPIDVGMITDNKYSNRRERGNNSLFQPHAKKSFEFSSPSPTQSGKMKKDGTQDVYLNTNYHYF